MKSHIYLLPKRSGGTGRGQIVPFQEGKAGPKEGVASPKHTPNLEIQGPPGADVTLLIHMPEIFRSPGLTFYGKDTANIESSQKLVVNMGWKGE